MATRPLFKPSLDELVSRSGLNARRTLFSACQRCERHIWQAEKPNRTPESWFFDGTLFFCNKTTPCLSHSFAQVERNPGDGFSYVPNKFSFHIHSWPETYRTWLSLMSWFYDAGLFRIRHVDCFPGPYTGETTQFERHGQDFGFPLIRLSVRNILVAIPSFIFVRHCCYWLARRIWINTSIALQLIHPSSKSTWLLHAWRYQHPQESVRYVTLLSYLWLCVCTWVCGCICVCMNSVCMYMCVCLCIMLCLDCVLHEAISIDRREDIYIEKRQNTDKDH